MPIYIPGKRTRHGKAHGVSRNVVAVLSLTAMVDMFTVLVVFLLQNYKVTGQTLTLKEGVTLPEASAVRELSPSNVIVVGKEFIELNDVKVGSLLTVRENTDWMIVNLRDVLKKELQIQKSKMEASLKLQLEDEVKRAKGEKIDRNKYKQVTIQADEGIDLLSLKKIMYTIIESGGGPVNFAVLKKERPSKK